MSLSRPTRRRVMGALLGAGLGPPAGAARAAEGLSGLRAALPVRAPALRALLVREGACEMFSHYRPGTDARTPLPLHSMTKSVLSWLIGQALDTGRLGLGQTLGELLPEASGPGIDPAVRTITLRHLLTMTAGLDAEAKPPPGLPPAATWRWSLTRPLLSPPGRDFRYDNFGANLLSVILTRRLGRPAEALAQGALFGPMGISAAPWPDDGDGHSMGAYGLRLNAPGLAAFGLLALRHGRWGDRMLVPAAYVDAALSRQAAGGPPFYAAYGYLWWVRPEMGAVFAAGSDGQLIYLVPAHDIAVVMASDKAPAGGALAFVERIVLPALAGRRTDPAPRSALPGCPP